MSERQTWVPIAMVMGASFLWGSSFIAFKLALGSYDPMVVVFGRMFLASLFFVFLLPQLRRVEYQRRDVPWLILLAVFEPCLYFILEAMALERTSASQAGMIAATLPMMVLIAAVVFLREKVAGPAIAGFVLTIVGAGWLSVSGEKTEVAPDPLAGNVLELLAMACAAGYMVTSRKLGHRYSALFLTATQAFIGSIFFLPFLFLPSTQWPEEVHAGPLAAVVYLGTFVTMGAFGLYNRALQSMDAARAAVYLNLIPVFAVILGFLVLGEDFTMPQFLASGLIFVGLFIAQRRSAA